MTMSLQGLECQPRSGKCKEISLTLLCCAATEAREWFVVTAGTKLQILLSTAGVGSRAWAHLELFIRPRFIRDPAQS